MDTIRLEDMVFYGYHGAMPEEQRIGQRFHVDVTLGLDLAAAGQSDDLADTVHYGEVYESIAEVLTGPPYQLLERVATVAIERLWERFPRIAEITFTITKPAAPVPGVLRAASVTLHRRRPV